MITVEADISGLEELVKQLDKMPEWLEQKADELADRLAKFGVVVARFYYKMATYAGTNDVVVEMVPGTERGTAIIRASGTAVLFIEFGTGITMPDAEEARADLVSGDVVRHGEYGQGRGANERGWFYSATKGLGENPPLGTELSDKNPRLIHTYGNPANATMYLTKKDIEENIVSVAREVFRL